MNLLLLVLLLASPVRASGPESSAASATARQEYLRGTLLERRGAFAEALSAFERALELDPESAFLAGEAADLALELEDWSRAEKWARLRLSLAPNDGKSSMILARVYWSRGQEKEAIDAFEKALKLDPASIDSILSLTELIAPRDPKRARAMLERFLAANPEHAAQVLYELAKLDATEAKYKDAIEKLRRAISLDEAESDPVRVSLGQVFEITHDTAAAINEYRKVLLSTPDDWELWAHIGELEAARGDLEAARSEFLRLKARRPDDAAAAAWLSADADASGDFSKAAEYLKASSELKDDPTAHLRLGYFQLQSGGVKEAMRTLQEARTRWPKDDRIAYYLALGHDDLGERAQAAALLREVLALKPDDRDARWQLATILEKMDKIAEAELEFRKLLESKPDDAPALNYLGYSLADRGLKLPEAEGLIRRALELEPLNAAFRDSLGWALYKQTRSTEAVIELEAAARAITDDETLWQHLAAAHESLGRTGDSWLAWRMAQTLGDEKAGDKADALQKDLSDGQLAELWRRHLSVVQGGVEKMSGLCELKGKIAGRAVSRSALFTFRAPDSVNFELLGPMFSTAWRARSDSRGFTMDAFPVEGVDQGRVEDAARGAFTAIAAALSGAAFASGPARMEHGWGRLSLMRPAWRIDLEDGLAKSIAPADNGVSISLSDFLRVRERRVPRLMQTKGRFWELGISCAEPKAEFLP